MLLDECWWMGWFNLFYYINGKNERGTVLDEPFLLKIRTIFPIILMQSHNMLRSSSISSSLLTYENSISNHALPHTHFHTIQQWCRNEILVLFIYVEDSSKCTIKMKNLRQSMLSQVTRDRTFVRMKLPPIISSFVPPPL